MTRLTGEHEPTTALGFEVRAFVPVPLPPASPPLVLDAGMDALLRRAEQAIARLDLATEMVPDVGWFLYAFVRKEAVVSSQIEGTQASLVDLLQFEATRSPAPSREDDLEEVCNYLDAMSWARRELGKPRGLPLSLRLLNELHRRLMKGVRGEDKQPGAVRRSQNWIGGATPRTAVFVPPPPHHLPRLLSELERYIHDSDGLPPLVRAGLVHVQFETLHPYLDGNGRVGRLLIMLLLEHWKVLREPTLYLSLFFKRRRAEYYERLNAVRAAGDWEGWTRFFLEGIETISNEAVASSRKLFQIVLKDRAKVLAAKRSSVAALRLFEALPSHPALTVNSAMKLLGATKPTVLKAISVLAELKILAETTLRARDRLWHYHAYMQVLREGTEL